MFQKLSVQSSELVIKKMRISQYKKNNPANPVILSKILRPFFSCFLCFSWLKLLSFMLFMSFMVNIYSAPAKLAIIGDTEKYKNQVDLLTVELSQDKNVILLERSDWDYLLREHEISQSNIAQKSIQFGRLLGADGLIIVTEETIKDKKYLLSKLLGSSALSDNYTK